MASAFGDEDYDYDFDMDRRRRSDDNDDDDEEERRKRNPYFSTERMNKKREMQKRGTPYFFPMWGSSPYARDLRGFFPLRKRYEAKRNLIDAFTRDDPTAFGYDKKKRSSSEDEDEK